MVCVADASIGWWFSQAQPSWPQIVSHPMHNLDRTTRWNYCCQQLKTIETSFHSCTTPSGSYGRFHIVQPIALKCITADIKWSTHHWKGGAVYGRDWVTDFMVLWWRKRNRGTMGISVGMDDRRCDGDAVAAWRYSRMLCGRRVHPYCLRRRLHYDPLKNRP